MSRNSRRPVAIAVAGVLAVAPLVSACAAGEHPQSANPTQLTEGVNAVANGVYIRNVFLLGPAPGQRLTAGGSAPLYAWFVNKTASPDRLIAVEVPGVAQTAEIAGGALTLPPGQLVSTVRSPGAQVPPTQVPPTQVPPTPAPSLTPAASKGHAIKKAPASHTPTPGRSSGAIITIPAPSTTIILQATQPSTVMLKGLMRELVTGDSVRIVMHFQRAGAVTLNVAVVPRTGSYVTYSPAPTAPASSATPLPATPTSTASGTPKKAKKPSATPSA